LSDSEFLFLAFSLTCQCHSMFLSVLESSKPCPWPGGTCCPRSRGASSPQPWPRPRWSWLWPWGSGPWHWLWPRLSVS